MTELLAILGLYLLAVVLISTGAFLLFGPGVCLIVTGIFSLAAAVMLARGVARASG